MAATAANTEKKPGGILAWAKSRKGQQTLIILAFMIIPLALLFMFTYLPFGEMVKFSFYKMKAIFVIFLIALTIAVESPTPGKKVLVILENNQFL